LISGSLSHENTGNQLGHPAPIITLVFLAITAVLQIVCLNRGLEIYDSTLVVPVFYGVYTATGWLNSLIFNDSVDAYASWTLFLIFVSVLVLISGVVLLTHKKPEPRAAQRDGGIALNTIPGRQVPRTLDGKMDEVEGSLVEDRDEDSSQVVWDVGEASDDEDDEHAKLTPRPEGLAKVGHGEEGEQLMSSTLDDGDNARLHTGPGATDGKPVTRRRSTSSTLQRRDKDEDGDDRDGFGDFTGA